MSLTFLHPESDLSWMDLGRCTEVDGDLHFPEKGQSTREAKIVCRGCEVREACLAYALAHEERFGIWGGKSERERRRLKAAQEAAA
jgi:WhiB family redox-sensing transcriptional regulator